MNNKICASLTYPFIYHPAFYQGGRPVLTAALPQIREQTYRKVRRKTKDGFALLLGIMYNMSPSFPFFFLLYFCSSN